MTGSDRTATPTADTAAEKDIARPLHVLIPLIQEDLKNASDAASRAGMPYYQAAGEKLLEAKAQLNHGEFIPWVTRNFAVSYRHAQKYMALATHSQKGTAVPFSSLADFVRKTSNSPHNRPSEREARRIDREARRLLERVELRLNLRQCRELANAVLDSGYKLHAQTLHPDRGGDAAAMARLNHVRDRLKRLIAEATW